MIITFWGVRGSIPCPGPSTVAYGGNTACVELTIRDLNRQIIIDAGSGIRELGHAMIKRPSKQKRLAVEIFLTHTHWDHIMGFPFFAPMFLPETQLTISGPVTYEDESLEKVLAGQWAYRYFPVRQEELSSDITYIHLKEGQYPLGSGLMLTTKYLNHPLRCLGYRFEYKGKIFCTCYDTEPFYNLFESGINHPAYDADLAAEGARAAEEENRRIEAFIRGADLLIYDTQYTTTEYRNGRMGWGHSPMEFAIDSAGRNQVKQLVLFHHDPQRSDDAINQMSRQYCGNHNGLDVLFAREGLQLEI